MNSQDSTSSGHSLRDLIQSSFYPNTCDEEVEKILTSIGRNGSFLLWLSSHINGCRHYILSVLSNQRIVHMKMRCTNGYHNMCGEEEYESPYDVILNCMENSDILKEKNGGIIELKQPVTNAKNPTRWYHIFPKDAERVLNEKGKHGSYLVISSFTRPGDYVLCVRLKDKIVRVKIYGIGEKFDVVKDGKQFNSIDDLISHYKKYPLRTDKGDVITLDQGIDSHSQAMCSTALDCCDIGTKLALQSTTAPSTKKLREPLCQDAPTKVSTVNLQAGYSSGSTLGVVQYHYVKTNGKCTLSLDGTLTKNSLFKQYIEEVRNDHGVPGAIRYYECANVDGYYMCWHDDSTVDCKLKSETSDCHNFKWGVKFVKNNDEKCQKDQLQYFYIIALDFKGPGITGYLTFKEGTDGPPTIQTVNATKFNIKYRNQLNSH